MITCPMNVRERAMRAKHRCQFGFSRGLEVISRAFGYQDISALDGARTGTTGGMAKARAGRIMYSSVL